MLLVAIAVAVTVVTSGAALAAAGLATSVGAGIGTVASGGLISAAGFGGAVAIGAGSAAVGSIVSQGVGVATGIQQQFSWKGVAMAALAGGVGAGLGGIGGNGIPAAVARGAASSALTQGIGVVTGLQPKFDWAGVAAAGVGAGLARGLNVAPVGAGNRSIGAYAANLGVSMASSIAGAATRSVLQGTDFGDNILAGLPDVLGQTVGNMVANGIARDPSFDDIVREFDRQEQSRTGAYAESGDVASFSSTSGSAPPLGPNDVYGNPSEGITGTVSDILSGRRSRLEEIRSLFADKKYSEIAEKYFSVTTDKTILTSLKSGQVNSVKEALLTLLSTKVGMRLSIALAHKGISENITISNNMPSGAQLNSQNVTLNAVGAVDDMRALSPIPKGTSFRKMLATVLGHELGHAILGYDDPPFDYNFVRRHKDKLGVPVNQRLGLLLNKGENVRYVENPLRAELGLPMRESYIPRAWVNRDFPELFKGK